MASRAIDSVERVIIWCQEIAHKTEQGHNEVSFRAPVSKTFYRCWNLEHIILGDGNLQLAVLGPKP